ncbi:hypothetical protein D3C78_640210 [compost metagenome]
MGERARGGDEVVEGAVVPQRHQLVPQRFEARNIAIADRLLDIGELRAAFQCVGPGIGYLVEQFGQIADFFGVVGLAFQVDHRAAGCRCQRVGEGLGFQAQLVHIVVEGGGGHRKAHAAELGDDPVGAVEGLRAQSATHFRGLIHHRLEPQLHQLVGRHQACDAGTDDSDFRTVAISRNTAQPSRVLQPVVEAEREVRAEDGDGFLAVGRVAVFLVHCCDLARAAAQGRSLSIGDAWWSF